MRTGNRPAVLIVSPTYSHPANQGNSARIQAFGKALQTRGIDVDFLQYELEKGGKDSEAAMRAAWRYFERLSAQEHKRASFASCWGLDDWCPIDLVIRVRELVEKNDYQAVIVNYVWLSRVFEGFEGPTKILDTHDLFGDRHRVAQSAGVEPNWYFTTLDEESRGFDRADVVIAIQSQELRRIESRTKSQAILVSHPVDPVERPFDQKVRPAAMFGYIGSANPWNQISIQQIDTAFKNTGLDWLVAGRVTGVVKTLESRPLVMGQVKQVQQFYNAIQCSLNPMVEATGLKIKTIEALAHDMPIIGSNAAFAGLEPVHLFHQCDDAVEIAWAAKEFAKHPKLIDELRVAGRELFFKYSSDVSRQFDILSQMITNAKN
ncbi:MAG: hypothetical protein CMK09_06445 [Ponticaulis sp.]|nr:hypothetical protein [Ponticaulis sp.]|tara:strand:- start:11127 stop:12254 length:1128 start_codon:yes stop_codon:yes gene_type:complete